MPSLKDILAAAEKHIDETAVETSDGRGREPVYLPAILDAIQNKEITPILFISEEPPTNWKPSKTMPEYSAMVYASQKRNYARRTVEENELANKVIISLRKAPVLENGEVKVDETGKMVFDGFLIVAEPIR